MTARKPVRKDTLFEQFIAPAARLWADDRAMREVYDRIDWDAARDRLEDPNLTYPDYYARENFHGIEGGYLNLDAAISYDPVTQFALPPREDWVRAGLVAAIAGQPRRILDLGCGTGSTTLDLKQAFPEAEVVGLDLSPLMLAVAEDKANLAGLEIAFRHGPAEATGFPSGHFDLVTAALLFHETPPAIARAILREAFRVAIDGGQVVILDGHQAALRQTPWLTDIFEEPYIRDYAEGNLDAWLGAAGFEAVRTEPHWWLHQISRGVKPLAVREPEGAAAGLPRPALA